MKKSIAQSILQLKCPKCRKGELFLKPGLFVYRKILNMPKNCERCGFKFEIEPGFWLGALWMSYPFVIIVITPFIIVAISRNDIDIWAIILGLIATLLLFLPLTLRMGRSIWIHLFVKFKP
jgi:uncharacterized protein (DUF983 family)